MSDEAAKAAEATNEAVEAKAAETTNTEDKEEKPSRFWTLFKETLGEYVPKEPYPFDGFGADNIIPITAPDTADRALAIVNLCDISGDVDVKKVREYLKALMGDEAFNVIWPKFLGPYPVQLALAFAQELTDYFFGGQMDAIKAAANDVPGGSSA